MKLVVGLGNLGKKYEGTRHNAGFLFLDKLTCQKDLAPVGECVEFKNDVKFKSEIAEASYKGEKLLLVKPQTYMNLSGEAVAKISSFYKVDPSDFIVISDDLDLTLGTARIRTGGSSGGHKGMQNIIEKSGDQFCRIRIGIRSQTGGSSDIISNEIDATNFVLSKFSKREINILDNIIDEAIKYLLTYLGKKVEIPSHTLEVKTG